MTGKVGWACTKPSEGCTFCYAERLNKLRGTGAAYTVPALRDVELFLDERMMAQPLRWRRPRRIFVGSMTDLFMEQVPDEWIELVFNTMLEAEQHTFLILTKRASRMCQFVTAFLSPALLPTVLERIWLGVSAEDQRRYDERRKWLDQTPAAVRFWSLEPLLGPIDMRLGGSSPAVQWVICGGESGGPPERALVYPERLRVVPKEYHVKPEALQWVRPLRNQCQAAGVPFFFKQWGGPTAKAGGRLLDGEEWNEYPK